MSCPSGANTNTMGTRGAGADVGTECAGANGACMRGVGGGAATAANVRVRAGVWAGARCHGSVRDACPQGWPGVARPSDTSAKNIGRKECRESRRKHVDRSDDSSREY